MSRVKMSIGSNKIRGIVEFLRIYRLKSTSTKASDSNVVVGAAAARTGLGSMQLAGVRFVHAAKASGSVGMGNNGKPIPLPTPPTPRPPPRRRFPIWAKLVLGSVISLLLAFWTPKWVTLLKIGEEAEVVVKEVEQAAEVVEKVATVIEKVSEELANDLPDGNKFKEAALVVEHVSKEAAKDAQIAEQILQKVDVVEQELHDMGEMVQPMINDIDQKSSKPVNGISR